MSKIQIVKIANSVEMFCPALPAPIFGVRDCFFFILDFVCHLSLFIWNLCQKKQQLK